MSPIDVVLRGSKTNRGRARVSAHLIGIVQELSLARDLATIMEIVRKAARELTGADGASFVLRDGDLCYYADEDAIAPLWKGRRFPMAVCVSGWVMLHREGVAIEDVFADPRVPADAYRPTFVKSLAMVPIRTRAPIGAIGNYWASRRAATKEEISVLQALADSTSIAMENVEVSVRLATLAAERDALEERHRQQEALSALVVHDLKSPATAISLAASLRLRAQDLPAADRRYWSGVLSSAEHIHRTALDLLDIARSQDGKLTLKPAALDLSALFAEVREFFRPQAEQREQSIILRADVAPGALRADPDILRRVLQNLVDNALRHGPKHGTLRLEARADEGGVEVAVCDEGPGIPQEMRQRVFDWYAQLEGADDNRSGRGLGLTFCRLAVEAHGGTIWIEANEPRGSRFCFRIPRHEEPACQA